MSIRRMVGRACVGAGGLVVAAGSMAAPAKADCVYAEAYVTVEGGDPIYLVGENDPCITQTDWGWAVLVPGKMTKGGLPNGTPNGYFIDIRVPSPV